MEKLLLIKGLGEKTIEKIKFNIDEFQNNEFDESEDTDEEERSELQKRIRDSVKESPQNALFVLLKILFIALKRILASGTSSESTILNDIKI